MRATKLVLAMGAAIALSACSTLREQIGASPVSPDASSGQESAALETKLARVQTENARLANRVLELQREIESLRLTEDGAGNGDADAPLETAVALREREVLTRPVVDNPETPEMANAGVRVRSAPRLTQPTFGATDDVFENEAVLAHSGANTLFGVHLASYREEGEAREGWRKLQRDNPNELGLLEPRLETVEVPERGTFHRLIGGGFSSADKAEALCANLKQAGLYCAVSDFVGKRLSLLKNTG